VVRAQPCSPDGRGVGDEENGLSGRGDADGVAHDVYGGDGSDHLTGGEGTDELSGGNNNDTINSVGGGQDNVSCGLGTDDQALVGSEDGVSGDCERFTVK
jgi:hypothetical protein